MTSDVKDEGSGRPPKDDATGKADRITRNLKAVYDEVANEPLPDHFLDLLKRLDEAEKRDG